VKIKKKFLDKKKGNYFESNKGYNLDNLVNLKEKKIIIDIINNEFLNNFHSSS
jgi:hypothetical protein